MAMKWITRFANNGIDIRWSYSDTLKAAVLNAIAGNATSLSGLTKAQAYNYIQTPTYSNVAANLFSPDLGAEALDDVSELTYTQGTTPTGSSSSYGGRYYHDTWRMSNSDLPFITAEQKAALYGNSSFWKLAGDRNRYITSDSNDYTENHYFEIRGNTHSSGSWEFVKSTDTREYSEVYYREDYGAQAGQLRSITDNIYGNIFVYDDEAERYYHVKSYVHGTAGSDGVLSYNVYVYAINNTVQPDMSWCDEDRDAQIFAYLSAVFSEAPVAAEPWKSVTEVTGTDGDVQTGTTQLAAVYDDSIGDVNTPNTGGTWDDILRYNTASDNAQLWKVYNGMTDGQTKTIVKSGPNKLDATKSGDNMTLTFKLVDDGTETTIYTRTVAMVENTSTVFRYLGMIADYEGQQARLNIITMKTVDNVVHFEYKQDTITSQETGYLFEWLNASPVPNPYQDDTINNPSGGLNFEPRPTEENPRGRLTEKTALGLGLFTAYRMTTEQLASLGQDLWNSTLWADLKNYYNSPTDMIMGLFTLPFTGDYFSTASENIKAGDKTLTSTGYRVTERYIDIDLGELIIKPRWDSYLDYDKYTKATLHLPFLGDFDLDTNDIMSTIENKEVNGQTQAVITDTGSTLHLYYRVDVLTGVVVAQLTVNGSLMYEWQGTAAQEIPYSWATRANAINDVLTLAGGAVATIGGGMTLNPAIAAGGLAAVFKGAHGLGARKNQVHTNGSLGGLAGALASTYPYLTLTVPKIVMSADQLDYTGVGTYLTDKIGSYTDKNGIEHTAHGFVKILEIHLEEFTGTDAEKDEIERLLKEGVVL